VILVWLFGLLFGLLMAVYSYFLLGYGVFGALLFALATVLVVRGLASWIKRYLILSERMGEEPSSDKRTLETNRYIFWRRTLLFSGLVAAYFIVAGTFFGITPFEALAVLPSLLLQVLLTVAQFGFLFLAQFALFFGPFLLF